MIEFLEYSDDIVFLTMSVASSYATSFYGRYKGQTQHNCLMSLVGHRRTSLNNKQMLKKESARKKPKLFFFPIFRHCYFIYFFIVAICGLDHKQTTRINRYNNQPCVSAGVRPSTTTPTFHPPASSSPSTMRLAPLCCGPSKGETHFLLTRWSSRCFIRVLTLRLLSAPAQCPDAKSSVPHSGDHPDRRLQLRP